MKSQLLRLLQQLCDDESALVPELCIILFQLKLLFFRLKHIRTRPYTPKTNGKAERFIQSALREWAYAQAYENSERRAEELPRWTHRYNWHRPHGGIKYATPISRLGLTEDNLLRFHI